MGTLLQILTMALSVGSVPAVPVIQPMDPPAHQDPMIQKMGEQYRRAVLAGDAAAVAAMFRDDGTVLPLFQGPVRGRPAVEAFYRQMCSGPGRITEFTIAPFESEVSGDLAFEAGTSRQAMTPPGAPGPITVSSGYTVILKRSGSEWKIAYLTFNSEDQPNGR